VIRGEPIARLNRLSGWEFTGSLAADAGSMFGDNFGFSLKVAKRGALDQHLPIIPITLNGPFDVLPIGSLNVHRHRMEMGIHPAVSTESWK